VCFRSIIVHRMPGFRNGGLAVERLCAGVNLVYGPNGSGKTTLGRAIRRLLSPDRQPRDTTSSLTAGVELDGARLSLHWEGGRLRCQENGADVARRSLAAADVGDRYMLAL